MATYPGNFVDSGIVTVPNRLRTRSNTPTTKLAYITPEEEGILQALKPGTPHKGPEGIPNYDSVDYDPNTGQVYVTTGDQASAMEQGASASDVGISKAHKEAYEQGAGEGKVYTFDDKGTVTGTKDVVTGDKQVIDSEEQVIPKKKKKIKVPKTISEYWQGLTYPTKTIPYVQGQTTLPGLGPVDRETYNTYHRILSQTKNKDYALKVAAQKHMGEEWADKNLQTLSEKISSGISNPSLFGLIGATLEKQPYEQEFLGSAGAANMLNQIHKKFGYNEATGQYADPEGAQAEVDRIIAANKGAEEIFGQPAAAGTQITPYDFEQGLVAANQGNKNFDMNYDKTASLFYAANPPQTSGGLEDLATAFQQGKIEMTKENTQAIQDALNAKSENQGQYQTSYDWPPGYTPPGDTDPDPDPGTGNQWAVADPGQIGYYNPNINPATGMPWGYQYGTYEDYSPFAQVRDGGIIGLYNGGYLNNSNGVIGLDGGGYLDDYRAADSLMVKDPQEDEEWEYNV